MIFTKGTPVWIDLNPFFINVDRLLIFLKKNQFTGHVKINTLEKLYLILIYEGDVVAGAEKNHTEKMGVGKSVDEIITFATEAKDESITLSVSRLSEELAEIFMDVYNDNYQMLHKNLHSDFSDIPKFLKKMQNTNFDGYIHFDFIKIDKCGIIVLKDGKVISVITQTIELTASASASAKTKLMNMILSESSINGAVFNICQFNH